MQRLATSMSQYTRGCRPGRAMSCTSKRPQHAAAVSSHSRPLPVLMNRCYRNDGNDTTYPSNRQSKPWKPNTFKFLSHQKNGRNWASFSVLPPTTRGYASSPYSLDVDIGNTSDKKTILDFTSYRCIY